MCREHRVGLQDCKTTFCLSQNACCDPPTPADLSQSCRNVSHPFHPRRFVVTVTQSTQTSRADSATRVLCGLPMLLATTCLRVLRVNQIWLSPLYEFATAINLLQCAGLVLTMLPNVLWQVYERRLSLPNPSASCVDTFQGGTHY